MAFTDETIIKLRVEAEGRSKASNIDLSNELVIYGETYRFAPGYFFDGQIELMVPDTFSVMPDEVATEKYPTKQRPQVILTNSNHTIDITLNLPEDFLKPEQVPMSLQIMKSAIREMYPATLFYDEGRIEKDDKNIVYMDFKSTSLGGAIYSIMFASSVCDRLLIGTFNCPFEQWEQWQPVALEVISTIREIDLEDKT